MDFLNNKYLRWYISLTSVPDTEGYTERHHIVPKCLGGPDNTSNLVPLTPRKHFLTHWLLTKITTGRARHQMLNALNCMRQPLKFRPKMEKTSWRYAVARRTMQEHQRGKFVSEETRRKIGAGHRGKEIPQWHREKIRAANTGRIPTNEVREKSSKRMVGNTYRVGTKQSAETRAKISIGCKGNKSKTGITDSEETRERKRQAQLRRYASGKESDETRKNRSLAQLRRWEVIRASHQATDKGRTK